MNPKKSVATIIISKNIDISKDIFGGQFWLNDNMEILLPFLIILSTILASAK